MVSNGGKRTKIVMSLQQSIASCETLGHKLQQLVPKPDLAIGIANGGILPTLVACNVAGIDFEVRRVRRRSSHLKMRASFLRKVFKAFPGASRHPLYKKAKRRFDRRFQQIETSEWDDEGLSVRGRNLVIIDDCIDSGSTVAFVRERLMRAGAASIKVAVLSWGSKHDSTKGYAVCPDIFLTRTIDVYPWALDSPAYDDYLEWVIAKGFDPRW